MRSLRTLGIVGFGLLMFFVGSANLSSAQSAGGSFVVALNVAQEVPAPDVSGDTSPGGTAVLVLNNRGTELGFALTYSGLTGSPTLMHFHNGPTGEAGGVVQTICGAPAPAIVSGSCPSGTSGTLADVWEVPSEVLPELLAGNIYINIHTDANGAGEIRGQIQ